MSQASNLIEKETLAQMFSCEFREIFKDFFFLQNTSGRLLLSVAQAPWVAHTSAE